MVVFILKRLARAAMVIVVATLAMFSLTRLEGEGGVIYLYVGSACIQGCEEWPVPDQRLAADADRFDFSLIQNYHPDYGISEETYNKLIETHHLDESLPVQYIYWVYDHLIQLDYKVSSETQEPVTDIVRKRMSTTIQLWLMAAGFVAAAGLLISVIAAIMPGRGWNTSAKVLGFHCPGSARILAGADGCAGLLGVIRCHADFGFCQFLAYIQQSD